MSPEHLIVLRHGRTDHSESGLYAGRADVGLNASGRADAAAWATMLSNCSAWHSPLIRAAETAALAELNSSAVDDLLEWDLGELDGQTADNYRRGNPTWSLFTDGAPGGESPADVAARIDRIVSNLNQIDSSIFVLVGHGQFSKALAARILGLPPSAAQRLAWGPAKAALFSRRSSVSGYSLTGWNRGPVPLQQFVGGNS